MCNSSQCDNECSLIIKFFISLNNRSYSGRNKEYTLQEQSNEDDTSNKLQ